MTAASNNPGSGAYSDTFGYNGMDQRYAKIDSTGSFGYTRRNDLTDSPVLSDGGAVYNYGLAGELISEVRSSTSKFYHTDGLGSTSALTSSSGSTTDTLVTDAFGLTVTGSGSTPSPFGFVGQGGYQGDNDTGLMLLGHRYYDSSTGRFLSRDSVQDGNNWYTYCDNDPVNNLDTDGAQTAKKTGPTPDAELAAGNQEEVYGKTLFGAGVAIVVVGAGSPSPAPVKFVSVLLGIIVMIDGIQLYRKGIARQHHAYRMQR